MIQPGDRFGMLTAVERIPAKHGTKVRWLCRCDCGELARPEARRLLSGVNRACKAHRWRRHGLWDTPEYGVHSSMIQRCTNPKNAMWPDYGGRGITVCDRWRYGEIINGVKVTGVELFHKDVGPRPSPKHSLDRLNNDGPYEPGNVAWRTSKEQSRNKRNNHLVEFNGRTQCMADWEAEFGLGSGVIAQRLKRGWDMATAVSVPVMAELDAAALFMDNKACIARIAELEATIARLTSSAT